MESLESVVAHIQALSSAEELQHLHALLKQAADGIRAQSPRDLSAAIAQLDPGVHSLGYLFLLEAYVRAANGREVAIETIVHFIETCQREQILLAPEKFTVVCRGLKEVILQQQVPIQGIAPLRTAIYKLRASKEHLTSLHADFLLTCLLARSYKAGLSILEDNIYEVDQPRDLFLYCYYGGMIFIGLKQFPKALEYLHNVFTSPMAQLNAIAVEAYKKYILVSLIHHGQVPQFPKYTSASVQRNMRNFTEVYADLATKYTDGSPSELQACIQLNAEKFKTDSNFGLAKQVLSSLYRRNIQKLTQSYLTLSLQDIASAVQLKTPKDAEMHVLQMIQDGEIFATINQKDGMVSFHEDPEQYKTHEMVERIDSSIQRLMELSRKLTTMDEQISCDPTYLANKLGKDRHRFDYDDFDQIPHRFM